MRSALLNSVTFLDTPADSRKAWASKPRFCLDFLLDLTLLGFAITCITLPLVRRFITIMRLKARIMIGGWWRSFGAACLRDRTSRPILRGKDHGANPNICQAGILQESFSSCIETNRGWQFFPPPSLQPHQVSDLCGDRTGDHLHARRNPCQHRLHT